MAQLDLVKDVMLEFAANTGLAPPTATPRRYLWTDGFAVCNLLELHRQTGEERFKELARSLAGQVHHTLARHRGDDPQGREGWISGLGAEEGAEHPTRGGLRIGKKFPERQPGEAYDDDGEWDKDGQYYHYLTKWMQALSQLSLATAEARFVVWGAELAEGVHSKFTYLRGHSGKKRMYWKMSVDLSHPLVPSMGHHDPLDGYLSYYQLEAALPPGQDSLRLALKTAMADLRTIMEGQDFTTTDPLGLGGILCDAYRTLQLYLKTKDEQLVKLLRDLLAASLAGLKGYNRRRLDLPAEYRLAFREFGLSIGLQAATRLKELLGGHPELVTKLPEVDKLVGKVLEYRHLQEAVHSFWGKESNRKSENWRGHLDINMVMWATSLLPGGFLELR